MTREEMVKEYRACGKRLEIIRSQLNDKVKETGSYNVCEDARKEFDLLTQRIKELEKLMHPREEF